MSHRSPGRAGGNALIGRELYPLLHAAGFGDVTVSPRFVYVDASRPAWVEGFTRNTYVAMVEGVREQALAAGLIDRSAWERGMVDLQAGAGAEGTFCYTFFKAVARSGPATEELFPAAAADGPRPGPSPRRFGRRRRGHGVRRQPDHARFTNGKR